MLPMTFPLNALAGKHTLGDEVGARGGVVDVVVARDVEAHVQAQVVDALDTGQPLLVGHDPSCLDAGEEAPDGAEELEAVGILAKAR